MARGDGRTVTPLFMLRIEIDGHFHGSGRVPRPWVARVDGPDEQYGLKREFVRPMNDWEKAHRAWSGNLYGVVATFAMRNGHLYEIQRLTGSSSRRHVTREFYWLDGGELTETEPADALQRVSGGGDGVVLRVREFPGRTLVTDLTESSPVGFCVRGNDRIYWLRDGHSYDVRDVTRRDADRCRIIRAEGGQLKSRTVDACPSATLS